MASKEPLSPLGAVVDLDGTLLDTEPAYYAAYEAVAAEFGHEYSFERVHRYLLGRAEHEGAFHFLRILGVPLSPDELLERRDKHLLEAFKTTRPLPGAINGMRALKNAGLKMAIATSSCRAYLELKMMGNDELFSLFDAVVCGDDPAVRGKSKPDPAIFLAGALALGVPPERCVAFEDSIAGIGSAKAAGMHVIAVPDPRLEQADLDAVGAHVTLASLEHFCPVQHARVG